MTVIGSALKGGAVVRPWIARGQTVDADIARSLGLTTPSGVLINSVHPTGPASDAGLKIGDVIVSIGGKEVPDANSLRFRIATRSVGGEVRIGAIRNGSLIEMRVRLIAAPEDLPRDLSLITGENPCGCRGRQSFTSADRRTGTRQRSDGRHRPATKAWFSG